MTEGGLEPQNKALSGFAEPRRASSSTRKIWLPGMDSNHELDRFLKPHKLLILKVYEVVKSLKSRVSVQNRYNLNAQDGQSNQDLVSHAAVGNRADKLFCVNVI